MNPGNSCRHRLSRNTARLAKLYPRWLKSTARIFEHQLPKLNAIQRYDGGDCIRQRCRLPQNRRESSHTLSRVIAVDVCYEYIKILNALAIVYERNADAGMNPRTTVSHPPRHIVRDFHVGHGTTGRISIAHRLDARPFVGTSRAYRKRLRHRQPTNPLRPPGHLDLQPGISEIRSSFYLPAERTNSVPTGSQRSR